MSFFKFIFPQAAVIYFILAWIITFAMSKILKVVDPKQKKKTNIDRPEGHSVSIS